MPHFSVLKEDEDPLEVFTLTPCEGCDAGCNVKLKQIHCPICPALKFKPNPHIEVVHKHLQSHFTGVIKIINMRGYKMTMCYQACQAPEINGGLGHYHCPFCPSTAVKRGVIVKHSSCCNASVSPLLQQKSPEVEHSQQRRRLTLDPQFLLGSPQLCDFNMKLKDQRYHSTPLTNEIDRLSEPVRDVTLSLNRRSSSKKKTSQSELDGSFLIGKDVNEAAEKKDPYSLIHEYRNSGDSSEFEKIFQDMTNNEDTDGKLSWISCMSECASLLDRKCDKLIIAFLKIPLFTSPEVANAANNFLRTLIGHHNYYAYHILKMLFHHLIPVIKERHDKLLVSAGFINKEEDAAYERVISSIIIINSDIPMTHDNLLGLTRKIMPYFQSHVHKHAVYARNLLLLASRLPRLRVAVLEVIISNMITIDVHSPRSELAEEEFEEEDENDSSDEDDVFDMEIEDGGGKPGDTSMKNSSEDLPLDTCQLPKAMTHKTGNTLDVLMAIMLQYVHDISHGIQKPRIPEHLHRTSVEGNAKLEQFDECQPGKMCPSNFDSKRMGGCECGGLKHNVDSLKHLYNDLKVIFSNIILRTHASSHVQFLLFYMLSLRPGLLAFFADFLINKKFKDPNCSPCIRKNAMAYIGSLLARGKHVSIIDVHACLESIRDWCNDYLDTQERTPERNYEDIALHGAFYYACQTLFYVFTFRYKQYTENKKTLAMARSLNLERYIHSKLNPLHICSQPVVSNFAAVAHHFQIAYCYTIIENNKRLGIPTANMEDCVDPVSTLDSFFPFDPYLLSRSKLYIQNHYREFEGLPEGITSSGTGMDVDDERLKTIISPDSYDSMYGISPGFVRFTEESVYN